jgi:hypothetical protein
MPACEEAGECHHLPDTRRHVPRPTGKWKHRQSTGTRLRRLRQRGKRPQAALGEIAFLQPLRRLQLLQHRRGGGRQNRGLPRHAANAARSVRGPKNLAIMRLQRHQCSHHASGLPALFRVTFATAIERAYGCLGSTRQPCAARSQSRQATPKISKPTTVGIPDPSPGLNPTPQCYRSLRRRLSTYAGEAC